MFTKLIKSPEVFGSIIITIGSILGSFFAYLLQFVLGRTLSIENYGVFNAFLSLATLITVPTTVFFVTLVKIVSVLGAKDEFEKATALFWKVTLGGFVYGLVIFSLVYFTRDYISSNLNVENTKITIYFGLFLSLTLFPNIARAYLQGLLRYKAFAFFVVISGFLRFLFPAILVFVGYKLFGVFVGMGMGLLTSFILSFFLLKKNFKPYADVDLSTEYKEIAKLGVPIAFLNFSMMALNNMDMILVKKFFDPTVAGFYAGTVTLGKILLFGAGSVTVIMFPQVSAAFARGKNYMENFMRLFALQIFVVVVGVLSYNIFPRLLTTLFFGSRFLNSVEYLPKFSLFVGLYVLVNFMVMFFLAINKKLVFLFLLPGVLVQSLLIYFKHDTLNDIINVNIIVVLLTYIALLFYFRKMTKVLNVKTT